MIFLVFANLYGQGSQGSGLSARGSLRGETIVKKKFYLQLVFRFERNLSGLWRQLFSSVVKAADYVLEELIEGNNFLKKIKFEKKIRNSNYFVLSFRGNCLQFCKSCNLCATGTFRWQLFVFTKLCFRTFSRTESDKFLVGLIKLFATFPDQNFKKKNTSFRKTHIIFEFMRDFSGF